MTQGNIQILNRFVKRLFDEIRARKLSEFIFEASKTFKADGSTSVAYFYKTFISNVYFEVYHGPMLSDNNLLWCGFGSDDHKALRSLKSEAGGFFRIDYELFHEQGQYGALYDQVDRIPKDFLKGYGFESVDGYEWIGRYNFDDSTFPTLACELIEQALAMEKIVENKGLSKDQLRVRADEALKSPNARVGVRVDFGRSADVRAYVLSRADGKCENCDQQAPFKRKDGSGYLESHHIDRRADDGLDDYRVMAGICPACHREIHHGANGYEINRSLRNKIAEKERG